MSAPRTKRPFAGASADPSQRQITAFFCSGALPADTDAEAQSPRQPLLPSNVQANLLSVGMRVRKSVPEGYKTVGPSGFKLWTDNTPAAAINASATTTSGGARSMSRELLPFCGINKVGGLDTQPSFREDESEDDEVPDLDAVPELTMSQESVESNATEPSRKRIFDDDEDRSSSIPITWSAKEAARAWDGEISPRTLHAPAGWGNARPMAIPRSRVRKGSSTTATADAPHKDVDQENMVLDGDFEEADFLVFGQGREMDTS
ncbi:ribonucleotide reductase inhibitor [Purpureocillium lavendulum]|uniref:Ribonucleotide reductase inhibitor n=1 Tax=Purpureocillium lavendulum TaxID=1247861 RepID=A0AB34G7Q1_9HYPO|nr:ribonucleotide reductase inhibitor [Purpureocillium lavendulum]